jgi:hypothetical protein
LAAVVAGRSEMPQQIEQSPPSFTSAVEHAR